MRWEARVFKCNASGCKNLQTLVAALPSGRPQKALCAEQFADNGNLQIMSVDGFGAGESQAGSKTVCKLTQKPARLSVGHVLSRIHPVTW